MTDVDATTGTTSNPEAAGPTAKRGSNIPESTALIVVLIALGIYFTIRSPYFLGYDNFLNILTAASIVGIIAAPATLLLVAGQIDLSVGSGLTFCGIVMAYVTQHHNLTLGVIAGLLAGIAIGLVNGTLVTVVGVNALITTLGTLAAFSGLAKVLSGGQTISVEHFETIGTSRPFLQVPLPVLILAVVILLFYVIMKYTVYGRSMYAIGANPVAARLAGIRSGYLVFGAFVISGLFVALAALVNVSQLSAASTLSGVGLELSVVTAVILGGASLSGGRGTVIGTILGLLIIGVLNNGLTLLNINTFWQEVARGVLLILAVSFDQLRIRLART